MDLNDLLARLKSPDSQTPENGQAPGTLPPQSSNYRQPSVSSPLMSPPLASPQPQSLNDLASSILSPANALTPDRATSDRTTNLLNLLKFNQPASGAGFGSKIGQGLRDTESLRAASISTAAPAAAAAAASAFSPGFARQASLGVPPIAGREASPRPSATENPQDFLLKLLGRPQAAMPDSKTVIEAQEPEDTVVDMAMVSEPDTPVRVFGGQEEQQATAFEAPSQSTGASVFTYINPFEQLAASSPRNKKTKLGTVSGTVTPDTGLRNEYVPVVGVSSDAKSATSSALPDGRTQVEALLGIGTIKEPRETVAQALGEVGEKVDKQAQEAIERAGIEQEPIPVDNVGSEEDKDTMHMKDLQKAVQEVAMEIKDELKDANQRATLDAGMPNRVALAMEDAVNANSQENVADSWESADAEDSWAKDDSDTGVRVLNFPMKPFLSIDLKNLPTPARVVRDNIVMKIASMKKEFDQVDRTLASATANFIVYAMARGGGLRIIRQDDGNNKQVFRKTEHTIYNVNISAPAASPLSKVAESVLATGINGSVYWTSIGVSRTDGFEDDDLDQKGFIFPPLASSDENTSGAQLKTRAKQSSRNPEFFAVSRGKSIHIIWPALATLPQYLDSKTRVVDSEKYLSERCLKIGTGKSGKDFAFSEDDTVIVSLDKAGRLKFWDIREHTHRLIGGQPEIYSHIETKIPLMVLTTTSTATEKSWATSVQFVDKERPTTKGLALRYLLVGSKQNHTLQLWDLGLGRPVQELNFPHESENDAICSVDYHAKSGIIIVGHPTRNSIFLIHLSSPRYNLGGISQAEFMQRLASKDPTLPRPDSTAIMSGIRELSLSAMGELRSLEIAEPVIPSVEQQDEEGETVFEVYVATSRGISCLSLKKKDFGWDQNGKVLLSVNAIEEKFIESKDLQMPQGEAAEPTEPAAKTETVLPSKDAAKDVAKEDPSTAVAKMPDTNSTPVVTDKPKKAANPEIEYAANTKVDATTSQENSPPAKVLEKTLETVAPSKPKKGEKKTSEPTLPKEQSTTNGDVIKSDVPQDMQPDPSHQFDTVTLAETISKALGNTLSVIFGSVLGDQLESLYKRFDDDKRVQEAAGAAKQDAVLRLVASTLTDNVEKSLTRIVSTNIQQSVLPALANVTSAALERIVSEAINQQLLATVPREMKSALQGPIAKAMQDPEVLRTITDQVSNKVAGHVEQVFSTTLSKTITPAFQKLATDAARKSTAEVERRVAEQLKEVKVQRQSDGAKIDQLTSLTMELLDTVRTMTKTLSDSQNEIIKLQIQLAESARPVTPAAPPAVVVLEPAVPKDEELEAIAEMMSSGRLAEGTIKVCHFLRSIMNVCNY